MDVHKSSCDWTVSDGWCGGFTLSFDLDFIEREPYQLSPSNLTSIFSTDGYNFDAPFSVFDRFMISNYLDKLFSVSSSFVLGSIILILILTGFLLLFS